MLIVLEGLDGAGKSTQVKMLKDYLEKRCGHVRYIHFPRYDAPVYGPLISRFLRGDFGSVEQVHPQIVALLFAEDRHGAATQIRQALEKGDTVLLDRYVYSNIAYQCAKLSDEGESAALRDWILDTEFGSFELPRPDINIFLDVPLGFVESSLTSHREGEERDYLAGGSDIHESDMDLQRRVRETYVRESAVDSSLKVVVCSDENSRMLPPDAIFEKIVSLVEQTFANA